MTVKHLLPDGGSSSHNLRRITTCITEDWEELA